MECCLKGTILAFDSLTKVGKRPEGYGKLFGYIKKKNRIQQLSWVITLSHHTLSKDDKLNPNALVDRISRGSSSFFGTYTRTVPFPNL